MTTDLTHIIRPPSRMLISDWAEAHAVVAFPPEPGKYHCDRMPWQRDMLDDPLETKASEIAWMIGTRLGKSQTLLFIVCYFIAHCPTQILVKYPTLDAVGKWLTNQFLPTVGVMPCMQGLIRNTRERYSKSTRLNRIFPGGDLTMVGANSPAGLRNLNKRVIIQEEIDADDISPEGDAVSLADKRAENFYNAVKLKTSSPSMKGQSRIEEIYDRSDKRKWFVPCAKCGESFTMTREHIRFSFATHEPRRDKSPRGKGNIRDTANAVLVCPSCEWELSDYDRIAMIHAGKWQATAEWKGILGRHLNGMHRIIGKKGAFKSYLHEFSENWLDAKHGGRETIRVHVNTFDAEAFHDPFDQLEWHPLQKRAEDYSPAELPAEVCCLTAGIDVHPDRVEINVIGWGEGEEMWEIDYKVVYGDFDNPEMQGRVDDELVKTWAHPILGPLKLIAACVDSGHQTKVKAVYRFCRQHRSRNVWAVKGMSAPHASIYTEAREKRFGIIRYSINTDVLKTTIYDRLKNQELGPRYIHFPKEFNAQDRDQRKGTSSFGAKFYKQLCSEKRVAKKVGNQVTYEWQKEETRNEVLDTAVYAMAAYEIVKPAGFIARTWKQIQGQVAQLVERPVVVIQKTSTVIPVDQKQNPPTPVRRKRMSMRIPGV